MLRAPTWCPELQKTLKICKKQKKHKTKTSRTAKNTTKYKRNTNKIPTNTKNTSKSIKVYIKGQPKILLKKFGGVPEIL